MNTLILTTRLFSIASLVGIIAGPGLAAAQTTVPNSFSTGDTIDATEMNDNFTALMDAVDNIALTPGPQGPPGADGADGAPGANGTNGTDGTDGIDGLTSLIAVTAELAGPNCAAGGSKFDVGLDDSRDGTLDAGEIDSTAYVCNGSSGEAPVNSYAGSTATVYQMAARQVPPGDLKVWYQGICEDAGLAPVSCDSSIYGSTYDASAWGAVELDTSEYSCNVSNGVTSVTGWNPVLTFHQPLSDTLGVYCTSDFDCAGDVSPVCADQP